ncbi:MULTISPECIES: NUDIX domain-containing protein [Burkholderiaceae]|uniref:NUDIX domain-containing protein n=1 Tax=Burkholderiaceae TaxID=119060 RepID=UPI00095F8379|nr:MULTISPECIES: NUDIX hydrolase [Burkholderiaceae]MCG1019065.1 NUDIX hydrolase [Mycetohabitans sp. B4]SIT73505.1 ADP-ribose pyrophosphatase [Burkholderia sp. b13]
MTRIPTDDAHLVETRLDGQTLYDGHFLTLKRDIVRLPDGKTATREFVEHPGAVMVLPLLDDGRVLMERQYRYPLGRVMVEFPAGKLDPQEGALACAQRELREETGYRANEFVYLTRIHPVISYSTEFIDLYLARGLTEGERALDDGEFLETIVVEPAILHEWIRCGDVSDVKTIIGAFWLEKILSGAWPENTAQVV